MDDLISRQAAIDAVKKNTFRLTFAEEQNCEGHVAWSANAVYSDVIEGALLELPSAQPEIIRCKDCKYGVDYYHDGSCYCAKPGYGLLYFDGSWEFYCANAERREVTE